jgi:hypothetical protein
MKDEYNFSQGERGKFYNTNINFRLPIYLEPQIESFFSKLADKQKINLSQIVNDLLNKDKELIELVNTVE